jgi:hypothetical protein
MTQRNVVSQRQKTLFIVDEAERELEGGRGTRHQEKKLKTPLRVCEDIKISMYVLDEHVKEKEKKM